MATKSVLAEPRIASGHISASGGTTNTLLVAAFGVFILGALVYLFDRSGSDIYFIPDWWRFADGIPGLFGTLGGSFPSFAHTYCFALAFCVLLAPWPISSGLVCVAWCIVEALFEIAQVELVAGRVLDVLPAWFADWVILENVSIYFSHGQYDSLDLISILLGGTTAWLTIKLIKPFGENVNVDEKTYEFNE